MQKTEDLPIYCKSYNIMKVNGKYCGEILMRKSKYKYIPSKRIWKLRYFEIRNEKREIDIWKINKSHKECYKIYIEDYDYVSSLVRAKERVQNHKRKLKEKYVYKFSIYQKEGDKLIYLSSRNKEGILRVYNKLKILIY